MLVENSSQFLVASSQFDQELLRTSTAKVDFDLTSSGLLCLRGEKNPFERMVVGGGVGGIASGDLSPAGALLAGVDCDCAAADRGFAGSAGRCVAGGCGGEESARITLARVSARLSLRNSMVRRDVLLDLRHDASLWWSSGAVALLVLVLFCMYIGLYHGLFGLLVAVVAGRGIVCGGRWWRLPFFGWRWNWRGRGSPAFPWELLGYAQTGNYCAYADCDAHGRLRAVV